LAQVSEDQKNRDPIAAISFANMEENYQILKASVDQDGNPFRIIRIPVPDSIIIGVCVLFVCLLLYCVCLSFIYFT
jgi:agmatine deiminase